MVKKPRDWRERGREKSRQEDGNDRVQGYKGVGKRQAKQERGEGNRLLHGLRR